MEQVLGCECLPKDEVIEVRCLKVADKRINFNYVLKEQGETNSAINLYYQYAQRGLRVDLINCNTSNINIISNPK